MSSCATPYWIGVETISGLVWLGPVGQGRQRPGSCQNCVAGLRSAVNTPWLPGEPEFGLHCAKSQLNSCRRCSIAKIFLRLEQIHTRHNSDGPRLPFGVFVGHHRTLAPHTAARDDFLGAISSISLRWRPKPRL